MKSEEMLEDLKTRISYLERSNKIHQTNFEEIRYHSEELTELNKILKSEKEVLENQLNENVMKAYSSVKR
jgi:hypothetical protein